MYDGGTGGSMEDQAAEAAQGQNPLSMTAKTPNSRTQQFSPSVDPAIAGQQFAEMKHGQRRNASTGRNGFM
jgi:hypothetical protein